MDIVDKLGNWKIPLNVNAIWKVNTSTHVIIGDSLIIIASTDIDMCEDIIIRMAEIPEFSRRWSGCIAGESCRCCTKPAMMLAAIPGKWQPLCNGCYLYIVDESSRCVLGAGYIKYDNIISVVMGRARRFFKKSLHRWPNVPKELAPIGYDCFMAAHLNHWMIITQFDIPMDVVVVIIDKIIGY